MNGLSSEIGEYEPKTDVRVDIIFYRMAILRDECNTKQIDPATIIIIIILISSR